MGIEIRPRAGQEPNIVEGVGGGIAIDENGGGGEGGARPGDHGGVLEGEGGGGAEGGHRDSG